MALRNVACPECGNQVSFTIDADEEIEDYGSGSGGFGGRDDFEYCGNCDSGVYIRTK